MSRRWGALSESMEGAAAAHICALYAVPFLEIRGISNLVTDRDRGSWQVERAVAIAGRAALAVAACDRSPAFWQEDGESREAVCVLPIRPAPTTPSSSTRGSKGSCPVLPPWRSGSRTSTRSTSWRYRTRPTSSRSPCMPSPTCGRPTLFSIPAERWAGGVGRWWWLPRTEGFVPYLRCSVWRCWRTNSPVRGSPSPGSSPRLRCSWGSSPEDSDSRWSCPSTGSCRRSPRVRWTRVSSSTRAGSPSARTVCAG